MTAVVPVNLDDLDRNPLSLERKALPESLGTKYDALTAKRDSFSRKHRAFKEQILALGRSNPDSVALPTISIVGACIELNEYLAAKNVIQFAGNNGMTITQAILEKQIADSNLLVTATEDFSIADLFENGDKTENVDRAMDLFTRAFKDTLYVSERASKVPPEAVPPTVEGHALYVVSMALIEKAGIIELDNNLPGFKISLDTANTFSKLKNKIGIIQANIRKSILNPENQKVKEQVNNYLKDKELGQFLHVVLGLRNAREFLDYTARVEEIAMELEDGEVRDFYVGLSEHLFAMLGDSFPEVLERLMQELTKSQEEKEVVLENEPAVENSSKRNRKRAKFKKRETPRVTQENSIFYARMQASK